MGVDHLGGRVNRRRSLRLRRSFHGHAQRNQVGIARRIGLGVIPRFDIHQNGKHAILTGRHRFVVCDSRDRSQRLLRRRLRQRQIRIEKRFEADPAVILTRGTALSQVWTNLIDNAADASPEGGQIEIATWNEAGGNGASGWLAVSVTDHGSGIPEDVRPHIFEPFFTTKPQGSGTGLGLEIVQRIVTQKFAGSIEVESQPGNTRFIIRLPMANN